MRARAIGALIVLAWGAWVSGCTVDAGTRACESSGDCPAGAICYRGFCVEGECTPVEPAMACDDAGEGVCMEGRTVRCSDGSTMCEPLAAPSEETCNGLDDDCDSMADEGISLTTPENCGACGASCGAGLACCADRATAGALRCVDLTSDDEYCGGCAQACDVAGGERCCDSSCEDLRTDPMNCGVCGRECPTGQSCCDGECVDRDSDRDDCGTCGNACAAGQECCRGTCALPTSSTCMSCAEDCAAMGLACCNGSCVDLETDSNHCGTCPTACSDTQFCCGGSCMGDSAASCGACGVSCGADQLCCDGGCVANNSPNCGSCGTRCDPGTDCCGTGCFDLQTDEAHCGTCSTACTGTDQCSHGHCCGPGLTWCGSGCVDLDTSAAHCGMCGRSCVLGCNGSGMCNLI